MVQADWFFRVHAIQRLFQRHMCEEDMCCMLLAGGEVIEPYPQDTPWRVSTILE